MKYSLIKSQKGEFIAYYVIIFVVATFILSLSSCSLDTEKLLSLGSKKSEIVNRDSTFAYLTDLYNNAPDSAIMVSLQLENQLLQERDNANLVRLYSFLSEIYQYRKNDDYKAMEYIIAAMDVVAANPELEFDKTYLYINVGNIMFRYGLFDEAIYVYRQIPNITDALHKPNVMALIYSNIALSFQSQGLCDSARLYFDYSARSIAETKLNRPMLTLQHYNYQSSLALSCENIDSIPFYFNKAMATIEFVDYIIKILPTEFSNRYRNDIHIDYHTNLVRAIDKMAEYYKLRKNPRKAIELYIQTIEDISDVSECIWCPELYYNLADAYFMDSEPEKALEYLDSTELIINSDGIDHIMMINICALKTKIFNEIGDLSQADYYNGQMLIYRNSLETSGNSNELMLKKIELAVKPVQLAMKNIEISRSKNIQTIEMQKSLIQFLLIAFVFIAITLVVYYRLYSNLKKTRFQLAARTIEKIKPNIESESKNKLKDEVEQDLLAKFKLEVIDKKAFLETNISLISIAERLDTNRTYISKIINSVYGMNFNDYINKLRIKEACNIICNNTNPNFTIDHLYCEVGFVGKSTFYTAFKKYTGVTPAVFFKMNNQAVV